MNQFVNSLIACLFDVITPGFQLLIVEIYQDAVDASQFPFHAFATLCHFNIYTFLPDFTLFLFAP